MLFHLPTSAQVFVLSCSLVIAVTTPLALGRVSMMNLISHATRVDLPIPWPEAVENWIGATGSLPLKLRLAISAPSSSRNWQAQMSGPYVQLGNRDFHGSCSSTIWMLLSVSQGKTDMTYRRGSA